MTSLSWNYGLKSAPKISSKARRVWGVFFSSYTQIILLWRPRCSMISNNTCSIKWTPLDVYIASSEIQDGHSFLKAKNGKFVGIRSKVVIHPTISLLITNWCPDSIFLVDYYIKSLLIGYWNLSPLFSHQGALSSIVSGWQRHLSPSHHSEQIHSLNVTSKPTRGRWDRLLGHPINLSNPKTPQYEEKLIWKWEQVVRRSCELSRKFSEQT